MGQEIRKGWRERGRETLDALKWKETDVEGEDSVFGIAQLQVLCTKRRLFI